MSDVINLIRSKAPEVLAANITQYKYRIIDGSIGYNMMGAEVIPEPTKGEIVAHEGGWYLQKVGRNLIVAHPEKFFAEPLAVGDKVEIQHAGFNGTEVVQNAAEPGMSFRTVSMSRKELECPVKDDYLRDLCEQLSSMKIADGRRGLHLLHDLQFSNFRAETFNGRANPFVAFEVQGAKFAGTVKIELVLGADCYAVSLQKDGTTVKRIDYVYFNKTLEVIEEECDSSPARLARVTFTGRRRSGSSKT